MLDSFMIQMSNFETAIAAKTITSSQFPLNTRKGKQFSGKGIHKIHARQRLETQHCFSPKTVCRLQSTSYRHRHLPNRDLYPTYISSVAVSAIGIKGMEETAGPLTTRQQVPQCVILRPL